MRIALPSLSSIAVILLMLESFVVKSVIFDKNDPVLIHYLLSGLLIGAICGLAALRRSTWQRLRRLPGKKTLLMTVVWLGVVTTSRPSALEWAAVLGFVLLVCGFYLSITSNLSTFGPSPRRVILYFFAIWVILSLITLVISPAMSYELPSLRFRGALISVANACNIFFFATIYFAWSFKYEVLLKRGASGCLGVLSFIFLLMTLTRSSILLAILGLLVFASTDSLGRIRAFKIVSILLIFAVFLIVVVMTIDSSTLDGLRLGGDLLSSRDLVWDEGLSRIRETFLWGTGLLTKQTKAGSAELDFSSSNYDPTFDAHALGITLIEQGGVLFLILVMALLILPLWKFLRVYGIRASLQNPEFLIMILVIPSMMFAGGDMISLGSLVNRLQWLFLGILSFDVSNQALKFQDVPLPGYKSNS
jgi:O-Antigen ligase